jgi:hypothetical protein
MLRRGERWYRPGDAQGAVPSCTPWLPTAAAAAAVVVVGLKRGTRTLGAGREYNESGAR